MPLTYSTATGETRTTCRAHRTAGYAIDMLVGWRCRECGLPQSVHESTDETVARNRVVDAMTARYGFAPSEEAVVMVLTAAAGEVVAR